MLHKIEENLKLNSTLIQLKAIDLDKKNNITWKLIYANVDQNLLGLDTASGNIVVNGLIDYEQFKWINLTLLAFDNGTPYQKHAVLYLSFEIEDLNDNQPIFSQSNINEFNISENSQINAVIARFVATDLDSKLNGQIVYSILSGSENKFSIDPQTVSYF